MNSAAGRTGKVLLIDELHTPDSSRFWKADSYPERFAAGESQRVRQGIRTPEVADRGYRGDGRPPEMPVDLWVATSQRYIALYELLTGQAFQAARLSGRTPADCQFAGGGDPGRDRAAVGHPHGLRLGQGTLWADR